MAEKRLSRCTPRNWNKRLWLALVALLLLLLDAPISAQRLVATIPVGTNPDAIAINPITNRIYVANMESGSVSVIDGSRDRVIATIGVGTYPNSVAVNTVRNTIYVSSPGSRSLAVIDGASNSVRALVRIGESTVGAVAVNPVTGRTYVLNPSTAGMTAITDTNIIGTVPVGSQPKALAVNPLTNKIYVGSLGCCLQSFTVVNGSNNSATIVGTEQQSVNAVALNPVTNKIYFADYHSVTVMDGVDNTITTLPGGEDTQAVAVNSATNRIYISNNFDGTVTVIDGATNSTTTIPVAASPGAVAVNPTTNTIYVASKDGTVSVIDGDTNATTSVATGGGVGYAVAINPILNKIYVTNRGSNNVSVIDGSSPGQTTHTIPLTVAIQSLPNDTTNNPTPTFSFSPTSSFSPHAPGPLRVYYQLDTLQGAWLAATPGTPFTGKTGFLQPGTHILYAFVADGQDATSINTGIQSSPLVGNIADYQFEVTPPPSVAPSAVSVTPASGSGSPQAFTFVFSHPYGYSTMNALEVLFNTSTQYANGCSVFYDNGGGAADQVRINKDDGSGWLGPKMLGSAGTLSNSQCTLALASSSASGSGTNRTLTLNLSFAGWFAGTKNIYLWAREASGLTSGWQQRGTWTPYPPVAPAPPIPVAVTPNPSTGDQVFSFHYADTAGYLSIADTEVLFNTTRDFANGCVVYYNRLHNTAKLAQDSGTAWFGPLPLGSAGTLQNSQCSLDLGGGSVAGAGTDLTVNLPIAFKPGFAGQKRIYLWARDTGLLASGWQVRGTWTPLPPSSPSAVLATPASGSGSSQTFSFLYSDTNGYQLIAGTEVLINSSLAYANGCVVYYNALHHSLMLAQDDGTAWYGPAPLGAGTLQNSQCTIDLGAAGVSASGNELAVTLPVTFNPAFAGTKKVYMWVHDTGSLASGWQNRGTWIVP